VSRVVAPETLLESVFDEAERMSAHAGYALRTAKAIFSEMDADATRSSLAREYLAIDTMATLEQRQEERRRAAERDPTYARIFAQSSRPDDGPG
jgi:hypothetical protein